MEIEVKKMPLVYPAYSKRNFYLRQHISKFVLEKNCVPLNPFMIFDYFLLDSVQRDLVRNANNNLVKRADELWIIGDISDGVLTEVRIARDMRKPVFYYSIQNSTEIFDINVREARFEEPGLERYRGEL